MEDKEQLIMDKLTKVCTCKSITRYKIKRAIEHGCEDLESIMDRTGAGTGYCKGKNCSEPIQFLIDEYWENK
ncbi:(2Fe-2S)-binding protein [Anaerosphaera multitolerans]|uniref:(2Fe-2S)-binding protein n=1 Tax=Anaerosphaera multitolerans TaxID=2487351 RepID=A0A437S626_9FIRM|nr:(2Fe-2S)-binding protein [Anaerosphaera multitolerans]RVU54502.1 (2Fe-2S)-binding protein [Anaerosphaera multitolerans]